MSQDETMDEVRANLIDAIYLVLADMRETAEGQRTPDMIQEMLEVCGINDLYQ
jgi:predicted RNase H-like HicB family nuclease